jgi:hypothetical protein
MLNKHKLCTALSCCIQRRIDRWKPRDVSQEHVASIFMLVSRLLILRSSRWKRYVPPKRLLTFNGLHGAISHHCENLKLYVNYVVLVHEVARSLLFQCVVSILWILIISWCGYVKCSVLLFFCVVGGGIKVHSTLRPPNGLLCQPRVIMIMEK